MTNNSLEQIKEILKMILENKEQKIIDTLKPLNKKLNYLKDIAFEYTQDWARLDEDDEVYKPKKLRSLEIKMEKAALEYEEFKGIVYMNKLLLRKQWTTQELKSKKKELLSKNKELAERAKEWMEDEWEIKQNKGMIKVINDTLKGETFEKYLDY